MRVTIFTVVIFLFLFTLFSCTKKTEESNSSQVANTSSSDSLLPSLEYATNEDGAYVVVLLGYGYNAGESKDALLSKLDETYGLAENGGTIIPFVYPDDFVSFGYERISLLPENIQDELLALTGETDMSKVSTLITIGSPDSTHYALANLQDSIENIRIFSVFSQDDILGTEAGSTLVIDYSISQSEQQEGYESLGEIDLSYPDDIFVVIAPLINAGLDWERIDHSGLLIPALRSEYTKKTKCDFFVYVDPQTGLRSENHYVLTSKES